ncbi:tandem-type lipoprotein [Staphylococcus aureus]|uniref:tandem-type lipoprotein n=1 Tax=Staphylococcus aureus TaxID=1280 RepID=UPI0021B29F6F|nr:tandem-type lipoprotein [Staphylococcus aureus]
MPTEDTEDQKIKKQVRNFNFFLQYPHFKHFSNYKDPHISYNPHLPTYSPKYQLTNHHYNLKQLPKTYHIPTTKPPNLFLKPSPNLKPSSVPYKHIQFTFLHKNPQNIYFTHPLHFNPTHHK